MSINLLLVGIEKTYLIQNVLEKLFFINAYGVFFPPPYLNVLSLNFSIFEKTILSFFLNIYRLFFLEAFKTLFFRIHEV